MNHIDTDNTDLFIVETAADAAETIAASSLRPYAGLKSFQVLYEDSDTPERTESEEPALFFRGRDWVDFIDGLRNSSTEPLNLRGVDPIALKWNKKICSSLFRKLVPVLAEHALRDSAVGEKATQCTIRRTAQDWAKKFSIWDLAVSKDSNLRSLPAIMEHDAQLIRWTHELVGSRGEMESFDRVRAAREFLTKQDDGADNSFARMIPSAQAVVDAIVRSLDDQLVDALSAIQAINVVRTRNMSANDPASGTAVGGDVLPIRVAERSRADEAADGNGNGVGLAAGFVVGRRPTP
jgi:hypothetical protein